MLPFGKTLSPGHTRQVRRLTLFLLPTGLRTFDGPGHRVELRHQTSPFTAVALMGQYTELIALIGSLLCHAGRLVACDMGSAVGAPPNGRKSRP